jgi:tetratricopeptide (TPR) repeat protein/ADP-heptose:LPS heptosyltransferase
MSNSVNKLINDAKSYFNKGDYKNALITCDAILKIDTNHIDALNMTAIILMQSKKFEVAIIILNKLISLSKKNSIYYYNRALAYRGLNNLEQSQENYELSIKQDPNSIPSIINLGNLFQEQGRHEEAIIQYKKAIMINPNDEKIYNNLGLSFFKMHLYENSLEEYKKAITINPRYEEAIFGLGNSYDMIGNPGEAMKELNRVIAINPNHARAFVNLAQIQLALGNFMDGWKNYGWRFKEEINRESVLANLNIPLWDQSKKIQNILVIAEQGVGDQILFYSLLNELLDFNFNVTVIIEHKLLSLFQRSMPKIQFIERGIKIDEAEFDAYIPMCDLGKMFRKELSDFEKVKDHYLYANEQKINAIKTKMSKNKLKCGISWKSNNAIMGKGKSFELEFLEPLLKNQNIQFINLQYGDVNHDLSHIKNKYQTDILDTSDIDNYEDMEGLAALIDSCDIIVTSSNSNAHLAGALGKETYLILPKANSLIWYWEHKMDKISQWYKSINIFNQAMTNQWADPISKITKTIEKKYL